METKEKSAMSYKAVAVIFGAVLAIVALAGFFPAKHSNAGTPDTASAPKKPEFKRSFTLKEWQLLAKSL